MRKNLREKFKKIDNTLRKEADGRYFKTENGRFIAEFNCEEENSRLFSVEKGEHRINVSLQVKEKPEKAIVPVLRTAKTTEAEEVKQSLVFEEINKGVDLEYCVMNHGVKENIMVKGKAEEYCYSFKLQCENVIAKMDKAHRKISFVDKETGEETFFIPMPFMYDGMGKVSNRVSCEIKEENEEITLVVTADKEWMDDENRQFPVTIDPQIVIAGEDFMESFSWDEETLRTDTVHAIGNNTACVNRMYMNLWLSGLPRNPRIKKAELRFGQNGGVITSSVAPKIGLYEVDGDIYLDEELPDYDTNLIDYAQMQTVTGSSVPPQYYYTFDITKLLDKMGENESYYGSLVLKMIDESTTKTDFVELFGSMSPVNLPEICITYENSYGVGDSYRAHTHEIGGFGQGSVDLACGNLMLEETDFSWAGNRMPVTLQHKYNSALGSYQYTTNTGIGLKTANFAGMKLGYGWKLNVMQSMMAATFLHEGTEYTGYVYVGENGEDIYFREREDDGETTGTETVYEDVDGGSMTYNPTTRILEQGGQEYLFDTSGRLVGITDENGNQMNITYSSNKITQVTDGVGRAFTFAYNSSGFLTSITAPDATKISYTYSGNLLSSITYPDGRKVNLTYSSNKPAAVVIQDEAGTNLYKVAYSFSGSRVQNVAEYGVESGTYVAGAASAYTYSLSAGRTVVQTTELADSNEGETANNVIKTVYTFDDEGEVISEYVYSEDTGNVGVEGGASGINPYTGDGGAGVVSNINNLLNGHNFESLDAWTEVESNSTGLAITNYAYEKYTKFGKKLLRMHSTDSTITENGVYQTTAVLSAGPHTFSAYARVMSTFAGTDAGAYIRVTDMGGNTLTESEKVTKSDNRYVRLIAPFDLETAQTVKVCILVNGAGTVYADGAQLENNPFANDYNMLENGNFEKGIAGWTASGASATTAACFNMTKSLTMTGDLEAKKYAYQDVAVKGNRGTRETFTLSGWAKGYGLVNHERDGLSDAQFRLRAVVTYNDTTYKEYGTETFTADFSPCTEEWQFASIQFSKSKYRTVKNIRVYCDYDYNFGTVYFDDVQLVRNSIEEGLTEGDFEEFVEDETDVDTVSATVDEGTAEDTAPVFEEVKDAYGNALTETTFTDGEFGTIYQSFGFSADGNNLIRETDPRGNVSAYILDEKTSRNEEITDRMGNKAAYEYDTAGRTTKITSKKADGTEIANVGYAYDAFDNMTKIIRGDGMNYVLAYNAYHNLESVGIEGKSEKLVTYGYKTGNGRLKEITYANGDKMKATYNSIGQLVAEKWFNNSSALTAHYKYVYDGKGNIVRSIDVLAEKEYNYAYENGILVRAAEYEITMDDYENVVSKSLVSSIIYVYDEEDKLIRKRIIPEDGEEQVIYYENTDDTTVVKFTTGGKTVTSHSKNDSFGRKVFDELQLGTGFVSRQFTYLPGEVTEEHQNNEKIKSTATTQLVGEILLSDGRKLCYGYDKEERITSVVESYEVNGETVTNTTVYTYDELGQLLTETVNGVVVNTMTYDNYGNILTKNGVAYTYGDSVWKDKLTKVGSETIAYDAQGNPTSYLGHTLTWEKGRQLKSFDSNTYTYNANGIRTSKTVGGVKHTYTLDGSKILSEVWGSNTLIPMYDNEDSVCGVIYNDVPFYFLKNLQGDVVAVTNASGAVVARYSYDAWGVCSVASDTSGVNIAEVNPYRYRGYYYDSEIGMYYLQSRYYDAGVGRFVNGDEVIVVDRIANSIGKNLFTYCKNSSSNCFDLAGYEAITLTIVAGVTISIVDALAFVVTAGVTLSYIFDRKFRDAVNQLFVNIIEGAIDGIGYITNVIADAVDSARKGRKYKGNEVHHIVAKKDYRAKATRKLLKKYGLDVENQYNKVSIRKGLHKHLHSNAYHTAVYIIVASCVDLGGSNNTIRYRIIAGLVFIGSLLKTASLLF